jgi:hypothetical protein
LFSAFRYFFISFREIKKLDGTKSEKLEGLSTFWISRKLIQKSDKKLKQTGPKTISKKFSRIFFEINKFYYHCHLLVSFIKYNKLNGNFTHFLDINAVLLTYVLHHLRHHKHHYDHKTNHQPHWALQKWHNGERLPYLEKVEKENNYRGCFDTTVDKQETKKMINKMGQ